MINTACKIDLKLDFPSNSSLLILHKLCSQFVKLHGNSNVPTKFDNNWSADSQ